MNIENWMNVKLEKNEKTLRPKKITSRQWWKKRENKCLAKTKMHRESKKSKKCFLFKFFQSKKSIAISNSKKQSWSRKKCCECWRFATFSLGEPTHTPTSSSSSQRTHRRQLEPPHENRTDPHDAHQPEIKKNSILQECNLRKIRSWKLSCHIHHARVNIRHTVQNTLSQSFKFEHRIFSMLQTSDQRLHFLTHKIPTLRCHVFEHGNVWNSIVGNLSTAKNWIISLKIKQVWNFFKKIFFKFLRALKNYKKGNNFQKKSQHATHLFLQPDDLCFQLISLLDEFFTCVGKPTNLNFSFSQSGNQFLRKNKIQLEKWECFHALKCFQRPIHIFFIDIETMLNVLENGWFQKLTLS